MLVDLPPDSWQVSPSPVGRILAAINDGPREPLHLATGVYQTHLNFDHEIRHVIKSDHPFDAFSLFPDSVDDRLEYVRKVYENDLPRDYGVCDHWQQILNRWPVLEADPRFFTILLTEIRHEDQSAQGGWRWHKWGEYIGTHEPQREYLYDEKGIERVFVFSIVEIW